METASGSVPLERRSSLTAPAEFGLIARCFAPLAGPAGLGLLDDAALLAPPPGRELVISADALVAGVHFLPDDPADLIARKLLRANLSDLAAKGAVPLGYLLTVAAPRATPEAWFSAFAAGLALDQAEYGVTLLGGDTTSTPGPVCLSLTILGHVAPGAMVRRSGARAGDGIWVTGTIGDAALGLAVARAGAGDAFLLDRYRLPRPRRPRWTSLTGWCRTSAICAALRASGPASTPPACRSRLPRRRRRTCCAASSAATTTRS
jgi:thiamine-monophosphate kinase